MPTLPEVLTYIQILGFEAILLGLFVTGGIIVIAQNWRYLLLALLLQYILVGIALARLVRPDIAVLGILIGAFICPILFISARQVLGSPLSIYEVKNEKDSVRNRWMIWWGNLSFSSLFLSTDRSRGLATTGFYFRLFASLLMILIAFSVSSSFPLTNLPFEVTVSVYWLVLAGLVAIILTNEDPMHTGAGLLTVLTGFGFLYTTLESSLLMTGLWGSVNLVIALAIGYLIVVKGTAPEEEQ